MGKSSIYPIGLHFSDVFFVFSLKKSHASKNHYSDISFGTSVNF